ncbi:MAG TPA: DNA-formamidopyrimidine glycosylase family protein, partial [Methylomirabilota bacterium]|nr:DNA-formamidopyrimidine glycosylase family protein [Methylomirabilota bacterium]
MPELPDITVYVEALQARIAGARLERVRLASPFVLRSVDPPISDTNGRAVIGLRRVGKRVVIALDGDLYLSIHLMIAGRLHWKPPAAKVPGKVGLAAFDFSTGTLTLTEAGTKKRAAIHLLKGEEALAALDAGGVEPLACTAEAFSDAITRENHTLKRALTDPHILSGIGNAYSDEILHRAKLSPVRQTRALS